MNPFVSYNPAKSRKKNAAGRAPASADWPNPRVSRPVAHAPENGKVNVTLRRFSGYGKAMSPYLALGIAIFLEVIATAALKASQGFTQLLPTLVVVAGYLAAFFFLSITLRTVPVGVAYAIWSGAGIVLISLIGWLVMGQKLDAPALFGIALIMAGVITINLWSSSGH